jgi:hypothetical protein
VTKEQAQEIQSLIELALKQGKEAADQGDILIASYYAEEVKELLSILGGLNEYRPKELH